MLPSLVSPARFGPIILALVVYPTFPAPLVAADAVQHLTIRANLGTFTALKVSSHVLVFDVGTEEGTVACAIDYVASARTQRAGEVILSVETSTSVEEPRGSTDVRSVLTLGEHGTPLADAPVVARRWTGGGTRAGRLVFTLRAAAAGHYVIPIHISLSTP